MCRSNYLDLWTLKQTDMRKFRFIGDPEEYQWEIKPDWEKTYPLSYLKKYGSDTLIENYPEDWQEVTEPEPKPLHKDTDLGYYAGIYILAQKGNGNPDIQWAITQAKELIKQLDNEK